MATKRQPRSSRRKTTGALAALVESKKNPTVLIGDVQQHAVKRAQADRDRRQDVIHPSEMAKADWCPRQTTYRIRGVEPTDAGESFGYQMLTIFQEGHDVHSKWQTWLGEMGRLWGNWVCPVCDNEFLATGQPNCTSLSHPHVSVPMRYAEVPLDAEEQWLIEGHADGGVPDIFSFIEVKTIGLGTIRMEEPALVRQYTVKTTEGKSVVDFDSLWKGIKRPFKSHRKQAAIYLAIAKLLGWNYNQMVFIYENKGNQAVREFTVPYDEELAEGLIDTAKDIKWAVEHNNDLPRPEGYTKDKKPCKECPYRTWCYAGNDTDEADSDATAKEDALQEGTRVHPGEHQGRQARAPRVPRVHARTVREEGAQEDEVSRRPRSERSQRSVRQERTTSRVQDMRGEDEQDVAREEPAAGSRVPIPEPVRDHGRGVRLVARRSTRAVPDL